MLVPPARVGLGATRGNCGVHQVLLVSEGHRVLWVLLVRLGSLAPQVPAGFRALKEHQVVLVSRVLESLAGRGVQVLLGPGVHRVLE